jgi:hypothetical protein
MADPLSEAMKLMRMEMGGGAAEREQIRERQFAEELSAMKNKMEEDKKQIMKQMEQQRRMEEQQQRRLQQQQQHRKPYKSHRDEDDNCVMLFKVGNEVAPYVIGFKHNNIHILERELDVKICTSKEYNWTIKGKKAAVEKAFNRLQESKRQELIKILNKVTTELSEMGDYKPESRMRR